MIPFNASAWRLPAGGYPHIPMPHGLVVDTEWGVEYRGVTVYGSEEEARRQLDLAQMDVPAVLVTRTVGAWRAAL